MPDRRTYLDAALFVASIAAGYVGYNMIMDSIGDGRQTRELRNRGRRILESLGRKDVSLDEYEAQLASEIINPASLNTSFQDIGGLDPIIANIRETIIYPLVYPELFSESKVLGGAPKGVLLYGPPGCGKTMMAKALAKESKATFINVKISNLANKWFGESNKLVAGVFSLARKLEPSIVFIDEIDAFLRKRDSQDHEVTAMMKAEFMTLWDGLTSSSDRIIVLGATNRPEDIDIAILRRMPKRFRVPLPDYDARLSILKIILQPLQLPADFPYAIIASHTTGASGSDLKEMCRNAAMVRIREHLSRHTINGEIDILKLKQSSQFVRELRLDDFEFGLTGHAGIPTNGSAHPNGNGVAVEGLD